MIAESLAAVSAVWGFLTWWVFHRFANHAALRAVRKRLYAHLLGIRLYSEEPALVWKAQKALVADNLRFLALIAKPVMILALPFALFYGQLESVYGRGPLAIGRSALVTMTLPGELSGYTLLAPPEITVETEAVRNFAEHRISWRIRALHATRGELHFIRPGAPDLTMGIEAGDAALSFHRSIDTLPGGVVIGVDYPNVNVKIAGLSLPWLAWFLMISSASAGVSALLPKRSVF